MKRTQSQFSIRAGSVAAFAVMILMNVLAVVLPINGRSTGDISNSYVSLFTPAGMTFSIWSIIYIMLLLYTIFQTGAIWRHTTQQAQLVNQIGGLYILTCLANAAWILCWHYEKLLLSVAVMLILLVLLTIIYLRIRNVMNSAASRNLKIYVQMPFSLYLGWISVATIANISIYLISIEWSGFGLSPQTWTVVMLLVVVFITLMMQRRFKDLVYTAVILWAMIGILIQHITVYKMSYTLIMVTVVLGMATLMIGVVLMFSNRKKVRRRVAKQKVIKKRSKK